MIPKDIETTIQWRTRHELPSGAEGEVVRVVNEVQARSIAQRLPHLNPVVEARLITVGEWGDPDEVVKAAESIGEEPDDECSHPGWTHVGSARYCSSCGVDRDEVE